MEKISGHVFQIQRWSVHDGDGIRTTVFLKGCPLRCSWCANPESWNSKPEILFFSERCSGCGRCSKVCANNAILFENGSAVFRKERCCVCAKCCEVCPVGARRKIGSRMTVEEVLEVVKRDTIFYRESGGGVTFSGGEPFAQIDFLRALVSSCKKLGIDTAVETSGYFNWNQAKDIVEILNCVFVDIKHMNDSCHKKLTGVSNRRILENIIEISRIHQNVIIRVPLICGVNDKEENIKEICTFLVQHTRISSIEILPCHDLGISKYKALGFTGSQLYRTPDVAKIEFLNEVMTSYGIDIINFK